MKSFDIECIPKMPSKIFLGILNIFLYQNIFSGIKNGEFVTTLFVFTSTNYN